MASGSKQGLRMVRRDGLHRVAKPASCAAMDTVITIARSEPDRWSDLLLSVAAERDSQAFAELFRHFAPLLKSFALSNPGLSSNALAEELVQEVMLKVWNRAITFDATKASATTWIYTLARNSRIDLLRRKSRIREQVDVDDLWDLGSDPDAMHNDACQRRAELAIRDSLGALPEEQRQIVAKVYMEGKSHTEVAQELQLPLGTVKSRLRLAMSKLKVMLDR